MRESMAFQNAARIGVNHKDGMISGVEQDGVGGLWADAVHAEKLFAELRGGHGEHGLQRATMLFVEKTKKGFQFARFLSKVTRRADEASKTRLRNLRERCGSEEFRSTKVFNGARGVHPGCVL